MEILMNQTAVAISRLVALVVQILLFQSTPQVNTLIAGFVKAFLSYALTQSFFSLQSESFSREYNTDRASKTPGALFYDYVQIGLNRHYIGVRMFILLNQIPTSDI